MAEILRRFELSKFTASPDAQGIIFVGGWGSSNSTDLQPVAEAVKPLVPTGSPLVLQDFAFGMNLAPMGPYRIVEEKRTAETVEELAENTGNPVIIFGESLGGLIAIGAGNRKPDIVKATVLLGTPATAPFMGFSHVDASINAIYSIHGGNDSYAPASYAPRAKNGKIHVTVLPGIDHFSLKGPTGICAVTKAFAAILAHPQSTPLIEPRIRMNS